MNMPPRSRLNEAWRRNQAALENQANGSVVIKLDEQRVTGAISAAVKIDSMAWRTDERTGQNRRIQTAIVTVDQSLLPDWALSDEMSLTGEIQAQGDWFKVASTQAQGTTLRIVANRWPDDAD